MSFENPRQIVKHQTSKKVLEFNDFLAIAPLEWAANLHARYSKIGIVIVDTTNGGKEKAVVTNANVDPIVMKCLYEKVKGVKHKPVTSKPTSVSGEESSEMRLGLGTYKSLTPSQALSKYGDKAKESLQGLIPILEKNAEKYPANSKKIAEINLALEKFDKGILVPSEGASLKETVVLIDEKKLNPNEKRRNEAGEYFATVLRVEYNPNMDNCWTVVMENGWGQRQVYQNGGIAIKRGSYRKEKENKIVVSDDKFREMVKQTNDYILLKEALFMKKLTEELEKQEKRY